MSERIGAGYRILFYGVIDADGYFLGGSTTAPDAGDTDGSPLLRLEGARTLPVGIPEPEIVIVSGDDEPMVSFNFDAEDLPSGVFEQAQRDDLFEALVQGTLVDAQENIRIGVLDPADRADVGMCMLLSRRAKRWESGSRGVSVYQHLYLPAVSIKPLGNDYTQRQFNAYLYSMNLSRSDRAGWTSINDTEHGTTAASILPIESFYPLMLQHWVGDNVETTFTLIRDRETDGSMRVYVDDVQQAETGIWTCADESDQLVFGAAPADGARIDAIWEYPEADIV